ncbi:MAG: S8 family serine peptidase [Paracoccaceae bacterium]
MPRRNRPTFDQDWLNTSSFDWKVGYGLVQASQLAYEESDQVQSVLSRMWGMQGTIFSAGETQGFVAIGDEVAIVSLRGTKGFADWIGNLGILARRFDAIDGRVHSGFLNAWNDAAHIIDDALSDIGTRKLWFTGHSLGAALAVLGAAVYKDRAPAGLVTFGQPRMMKRDAAETIRTAYGARYARIVNDNDIVPRVPPNFGHTGRLFHFDFAGQLKDQGVGFESDDSADDAGPEPLSEEAFEQMEEEIAVQTGLAADPTVEDDVLTFDFEGPDAAPDPNAVIEGQIAGIAAHRIGAYMNVLRLQAFPDRNSGVVEAVSDMDTRIPDDEAGLEPEADGGFRSGPPVAGFDRFSPFESDTHPAPAPARQPILIRLSSSNWTPPDGLVIQSQFANFVTALATRDNLLALENNSAVVTVENSRDAGMEELIDSIPFVAADQIHRPPLAEKGDGAIVGIIDTGVDILHQAFCDEGGQSRLLALWDQRATEGPTPADVDPNAFTQNYGRLYLRDEIQDFITRHHDGAPNHPPRLRDPNGHGTHVAGIAAGRSTGDLPDGIAPKAAMIAIISNITRADGDPFSIGYSNAHVDGLAFMKSAAAGGNAVSDAAKPIAVNISQGMNAGAHDGTTTLEAAFDAISGMGRDPGFVIVKSAGNERGHAGHASKSAFQDGVEEISWTSGSNPRRADYFEAWFEDRDDIAFVLIDPSGSRSLEVSFDEPDQTAMLGGNTCLLHLSEMHSDNGHHRLSITIKGSIMPIQPGKWRLEIIGRSVISQKGEVHIWVERTRTRDVKFDVEDEEMTLSIPGTAQTVISVGACNSETPLRLNGSSSWGLTRDGRRKPELCAPGLAVTSARSNADDLSAATARSGTSMAAPHVTGALALVMSHRAKTGQRQWNAQQLQSALIRNVDGVPNRHHIGAGFGKLNALKLFENLK